MILQPLVNIAEICSQKGILEVVISPGSRSAVLTLAFARHPKIKTTVIPDERVAGFVALGMAQQSNKTVALVCTSGSAAYNLAPAIVEAFFQEISLLIFTADRPTEWAGQQDGQTMYQTNLYGKHVKKSYQIPSDYTNKDAVWAIERIVNEAINLTQMQNCGPVHINVPIREPFYPTSEEVFEYDRNVRIIERVESQNTLSTETWHRLQTEWENADKILIAVGQNPPNEALWKVLKQFSEEMGVVILGDCTSNIPDDDTFVRNHDVIFGSKNEALFQDLQPDLLITIGNSFLSKNFKQFIRKNTPHRHWHLKETDEIIDSLQSMTCSIPVDTTYFFSKLLEDLDYQQFVQNDDGNDERSEYKLRWETASNRFKNKLNKFLNQEKRWNEFEIVRTVLEQIPENSILHLANSMPVRYVNLLGVPKGVEVRSNRGVSGIDGCTSTAVGGAMQTDKLVFLLTGDVAFFYDRNALWHSQVPDNLRIILLNNGGGNIFRIIDGPSAQPELEQYFETRHHTSAKRTCEDAGLTYQSIRPQEKINLDDFTKSSDSSQLLEIFTDPVLNAEVFEAYRLIISEK